MGFNSGFKGLNISYHILSPWPNPMIFLYFLFRPLLPFATFSSVYLFSYTPKDSNPMQFSVLLYYSIAPASLRNVCKYRWWFEHIVYLLVRV